jgi:hypothetical protein
MRPRFCFDQEKVSVVRYLLVWWFAKRSHRTQHIVVLRAEAYHSTRTQSKTNKGKRYMGAVQEKTARSFQHPLPGQPHGMYLILSSNQ